MQSDPYASPNSQPQEPFVEPQQPRIFSLHGRIGRLRWVVYNFIYSLCATVPGMFLLALSLPLLQDLQAASADQVTAVYSAPVIIITMVIYGLIFSGYFVASKRRLNDLDHSGWWGLMGLVPLLNVLLFIYLLLWPGGETSNRYGAKPQANSQTLIFIAALLVIATLGFIGGMINVLQNLEQ